MVRDPARDWMWSEACEMLARAERMHREFFKPLGPSAPRGSSALGQSTAWEPPVDILETDDEVLVLIALPGVDAEQAEAMIEDGDLIVGGTRILPPELRTAIIHRLELPQGRFLRRVPLPPGRYSHVRRAAADGCLLIALQKSGGRS